MTAGPTERESAPQSVAITPAAPSAAAIARDIYQPQIDELATALRRAEREARIFEDAAAEAEGFVAKRRSVVLQVWNDSRSAARANAAVVGGIGALIWTGVLVAAITLLALLVSGWLVPVFTIAAAIGFLKYVKRALGALKFSRPSRERLDMLLSGGAWSAVTAAWFSIVAFDASFFAWLPVYGLPLVYAYWAEHQKYMSESISDKLRLAPDLMRARRHPGTGKLEACHLEHGPSVGTSLSAPECKFAGGEIGPGDVFIRTYVGSHKDHVPFRSYSVRLGPQKPISRKKGPDGKPGRPWEEGPDGRRLSLIYRFLGSAMLGDAARWAQVAEMVAPDIQEIRGNLARATREAAECRAQIKALEARIDAWGDLFLPESVMQSLVTSLHLVTSGQPGAPSGTLLYGPPGTGKTEVGRRLAEAAGVPFLYASASTLKSSHVGGTEEAVRMLWERARGHDACVLFVDECDAVFPSRNSPNVDTFARSLTEAFLTHWQGMEDSSSVWVVGATNHRDRIDSAILSRFSDSIEIGLPDASARRGQLEKLFRAKGIAAEVAEALVEQTNGCSGRDLGSIVNSIVRLTAVPGRNPKPVTDAIWQEAIASVRGKASVQVSSRASWDTLVLPPETMRELQTATAMLRYSEQLRSQNMTPPRGIILYGPPGTGKTQVARTMARESGLTFVSCTPAELKAGYVGQTAQLVSAKFEQARSAAPAILFIDELDGVAPERGTGDSFSEDLVNQLLQELDGVVADDRTVFLVAATNRLDSIDPAVLSRFPQRLSIPLPTEEARAQILTALLKDKPVDFDVPGPMLDDIAARTTDWSGRDLRSLVERAEHRAFERALASGAVDNIRLSAEDFVLR